MGRDLNRVKGETTPEVGAQASASGGSPRIDVSGEVAGTVPDRAWRARVAAKQARCERRRHISFPPGCGISDKRPWTVGDNVNLAVGQGDLQATPLQMAVAYSAIGTAARSCARTSGSRSRTTPGGVLQQIDPGAARNVKIDPARAGDPATGLHAAASEPGGTSADVFRGWPQDSTPCFGKTGTAQRAGPGRPVLVRLLRPEPDAADRGGRRRSRRAASAPRRPRPPRG